MLLLHEKERSTRSSSNHALPFYQNPVPWFSLDNYTSAIDDQYVDFLCKFSCCNIALYILWMRCAPVPENFTVVFQTLSVIYILISHA
jgi:hypothetical protein